jgi:hypothetical protein
MEAFNGIISLGEWAVQVNVGSGYFDGTSFSFHCLCLRLTRIMKFQLLLKWNENITSHQLEWKSYTLIIQRTP